MRRRLLTSQGIDYLEFKKTQNIVPSRSAELEFIFELNASKITPDQIIFESSNENITFGEVTFVSFKNKGTGKVTVNCNANVAINTEITIIASTPYVNTSCTIKTINGILKDSLYICSIPTSSNGTIINNYSGHIANIPASTMHNKLAPISNLSSSTIASITYRGLNFVFVCKAQYADGTYVNSISNPELFNYYIGSSATEYLSQTSTGVVIKPNFLYRTDINVRGTYYLNVEIDGEYNCLKIIYPTLSLVAQVSGTNITTGGQIVDLSLAVNTYNSGIGLRGVHLNSSGATTGFITVTANTFAHCIEDTSIVQQGPTYAVWKGIKEDSAYIICFIGSSAEISEYVILKANVGAYSYSLSVDPKEITLYENVYTQLHVWYKTYYHGTLESSVDVSSNATYSTLDSAIATVSSTGEVRAVSEGTTFIKISYNNKTVSAKIIVEKEQAPDFLWIGLAIGTLDSYRNFIIDDWQIGTAVELEKNESICFKIFGEYADGSLDDISHLVEWDLHPLFAQYFTFFRLTNNMVNGEMSEGVVYGITAKDKPINFLYANIYCNSQEDGYPDTQFFLNFIIV